MQRLIRPGLALGLIVSIMFIAGGCGDASGVAGSETPTNTTAAEPLSTPTQAVTPTASPIVISPTAPPSTKLISNLPTVIRNGLPTPTLIVAPSPTAEKVNQARVATLTPKVTNPPVPTTIMLSTTASSRASEVNGPDQEEQDFLQQLNRYRQANGRPLLAFEPLLFKSARWMAQDMAIKNNISHTDSQGRDIFTRIKAFGYSGRWVGENIAGGFEHAADNLAIWQSDDIHKNNLLGASYTRAGIGRYYSKTAFNHWNWVLDLG